MRIEHVWQRFQGLVYRFAGDQRGNIAMIFALSLVPVMGAVGAAVDYSRANSVKTAVQGALDSTALMLSKTAGSQTNSQLQTAASQYFAAMLHRPEAITPTVSVDYSQSTSTVVLTATTAVNTDFMGLMGFKTLNIRATSTATWGSSSFLRVALVLDNTGSMAQNGKMPALQTATKNLISSLNAAAKTNGDVYVSIVPFVKDVNLGPTNYNQPWLLWDDGTDNSWDGSKGSCSVSGSSTRSQCTSSGTCSVSGNTSQSNCTASGRCSISGNSTQNSCVADGVCSNSKWDGNQSKCSQKGDVWTPGVWTLGVWTAGTWTPTSHSTWNGCVVDRGDPNGPSSGNYDANATAPTTSIPASLYVPEQYSSCPQAAMGLSYSWSAMTTLVNNMSPAGNTNQAIGLQAGWQSLAGGGPFTAPPKTPNVKYSENIILLTDGLNTQDRWYSNQASIDAREQILCNNIKAAGITLWTIQVNTSNDPTSTLLQNCASAPEKFFLLTSASSIASTFDLIGTQMTKLHLAH